MMAYDKEFRPDTRLTPSPYHGVSSEGSLSPDRSEISRENTVLCVFLNSCNELTRTMFFLFFPPSYFHPLPMQVWNVG